MKNLGRNWKIHIGLFLPQGGILGEQVLDFMNWNLGWPGCHICREKTGRRTMWCLSYTDMLFMDWSLPTLGSFPKPCFISRNHCCSAGHLSHGAKAKNPERGVTTVTWRQAPGQVLPHMLSKLLAFLWQAVCLPMALGWFPLQISWLSCGWCAGVWLGLGSLAGRFQSLWQVRCQLKASSKWEIVPQIPSFCYFVFYSWTLATLGFCRTVPETVLKWLSFYIKCIPPYV